MKKKTLADKINSLITTTPTNFGSDEEAEETKAKVVERYDESDNSESDIRWSKIRKQNVDLLDQVDNRYAGKKVSRKDVYKHDSNSDSDMGSVGLGGNKNSEDEILSSQEDVDSENNSSEDEVNDDNDDGSSNLSGEELSGSANESNSDQYSKDSEDNSDVDDEDYNIDISNSSHKDQGEDSKFNSLPNINVKADIDKGNCVRHQLKVWESLLEMRIKLQKCVVISNQMPQYDVHKNFRMESDYMKNNNDMKNKLSMLLNNMLQLQNCLLKQYPETKNLQSRKRKADESKNDEICKDDLEDEEIPSDTEDENENVDSLTLEKDIEECNESIPLKRLKFANYEKILDENYKSYVDYRNSVIQKWNDKTRITTGNVNKAMGQTTLKQIEFALIDKPKLRKKTQLKRSEYNIVGKRETLENDNDGRRVQEYDPEIFDDDDFYHQLLRDLIEYKSSDVMDPIQLSKQWIQLQNMRRKMKRKIDTRATKGRRIRYDVHNKLVNFMAPIVENDKWTDCAKNELYNSLFGKIKAAEGEVSH